MMEGELTSDALTASYRLIQRRRGHRFSVDDLATARAVVQVSDAVGVAAPWRSKSR